MKNIYLLLGMLKKVSFLQNRFTVADLEGEGGRNPPPHSRYRPPRKKKYDQNYFHKIWSLEDAFKVFY